MKKDINPAVFVVAIVAVVGVALFFGVRALFPPDNPSNLSASQYKTKMMHQSTQQQTSMEQMKTHVGAGSSAGYYQEYMKHRNDGAH